LPVEISGLPEIQPLALFTLAGHCYLCVCNTGSRSWRQQLQQFCVTFFVSTVNIPLDIFDQKKIESVVCFSLQIGIKSAILLGNVGRKVKFFRRLELKQTPEVMING